MLKSSKYYSHLSPTGLPAVTDRRKLNSRWKLQRDVWKQLRYYGKRLNALSTLQKNLWKHVPLIGTPAIKEKLQWKNTATGTF